MLVTVKRYFQFDQLHTNFKQEIIAGLTTFFAMAYIIIVNPKILEAAGIPVGPSMIATILTAFFGTMAMGLYARRPFAIAPYMGENAFIAYTVVNILHYSWQTALGAIFIGGVLFTLISVLGIRTWLANSIPDSLKISFAVGIGLFLTFIGLNETGIITVGVIGAPVHVGNLHEPTVILAIVCFILISLFMIRKIKGGFLLSILIVTFLAYLFKASEIPKTWFSAPPSIEPIFLKLDIVGALSWGFLSVILSVFVMDFVDTTGTLLGLAYKSGFLDKNGNLPEIEKPMLVDSVMTMVGALLGTTTSGTFIESAAGIESGGRSGFTSVVTALMFLLALFLAPFLTAVPACAYGPVLIIVGFIMMSTIAKLNFLDLSEAIPAFCIIVLMSFTYNLGVGMTAGFVVYPLMKLFDGKIKNVPAGLWILFMISVLFFIFYPYS